MPKLLILVLLILPAFISIQEQSHKKITSAATLVHYLAPRFSAVHNINATKPPSTELKIKTRFFVTPENSTPENNGGFLISESASTQISDATFNLLENKNVPANSLFNVYADPKKIMAIHSQLAKVKSKLMDAPVMEKKEVLLLLSESTDLHNILENYQKENYETMKAFNMALAIIVENAVQHGWKNEGNKPIPVEIGITNQELVVRITSPYLPQAQLKSQFLNTPLTSALMKMGSSSTSPYVKYKAAMAKLGTMVLSQFPKGSFVFYTPDKSLLNGSVQDTLATYLVISLSPIQQDSMQQRMQAIKTLFENYTYDTGLLFKSA